MKRASKLFVIMSVCVAAMFLESSAHARQLLIDTSPSPTATSNRCDAGISLAIQPTRNTTIGRLQAQITVTSAGNTTVRFAIFNEATQARLFYSDPVQVVPGSQFVESPVFSFELLSTIKYHIVAMIAGCADYPFDQTMATVNGLQTFSSNGNPTSFANPVLPNSFAGVDPRILIFTTETDEDGDGVANATDTCPFAYQAAQTDTDGDGLGDQCDPSNGLDLDADTILNTADNCPFDANTAQTDTDVDGLGDACDPLNGANTDLDGDGILNTTDNCAFVSNASQADTDADGIGDTCDTANNNDVDGDTVANSADNCPFDANTTQTDVDADGLGDLCDNANGSDVDGDTIANTADNCPFVTNSDQADDDADGFGDACDETVNADDTGCCSIHGAPGTSSVLLALMVGLALVTRRRRRARAD